MSFINLLTIEIYKRQSWSLRPAIDDRPLLEVRKIQIQAKLFLASSKNKKERPITSWNPFFFPSFNRSRLWAMAGMWVNVVGHLKEFLVDPPCHGPEAACYIFGTIEIFLGIEMS